MHLVCQRLQCTCLSVWATDAFCSSGASSVHSTDPGLACVQVTSESVDVVAGTTAEAPVPPVDKAMGGSALGQSKPEDVPEMADGPAEEWFGAGEGTDEGPKRKSGYATCTHMEGAGCCPHQSSPNPSPRCELSVYHQYQRNLTPLPLSRSIFAYSGAIRLQLRVSTDKIPLSSWQSPFVAV